MLTVLILAFLGLGADTVRLNPAQQVSLPYRYSLVQWEAANLLSKWIHRVAKAFPWSSLSAEEKRSVLEEYFRLGEEIRALNAQLEEASAQANEAGTTSLVRLGTELTRLKSNRNGLRNDVEEVLEATISAVLVEVDISSWGEIVFPPVDIRLGEPPKVLVTSPRDRIIREDDVLLDPGLSILQIEGLEDSLEEDWDLAGLVTGIGGVATYPSSIIDTAPLRGTLRIAAHEWVHQYLVFHPLGRRIYSSPEMRTLNETFSDIAEREIGDRAFELLGGTPDPPLPRGGEAPEVVPQEDNREDPDEFDFAKEMRKTRQHVDQLLADGAIQQAETYMEERRMLFVDQGFNIRKLNQAYFAFHGTYAESPASISPIGDQLNDLRDLIPDFKTFVTTMSRISSYPEFLDTLERLNAESER